MDFILQEFLNQDTDHLSRHLSPTVFSVSHMDLIRLLLYLFASRVCQWLHTQACVQVRGQLSPSTFIWALGLKLRSLCLGSEPSYKTAEPPGQP